MTGKSLQVKKDIRYIKGCQWRAIAGVQTVSLPQVFEEVHIMLFQVLFKSFLMPKPSDDMFGVFYTYMK